MSQVITWVKANVFIVVFVALMLVAMVAGPIVAGSLNSSAVKAAETRAAAMPQLVGLERTQFQINQAGKPPIEHTVVINPRLLEDYRLIIERLKTDAGHVRAQAVRHNSKDRTVLMDGLFPEPPMEQRETIPFEFHKRLVQAYQDLLTRINAGAPVTPAELAENLTRREIQYISTIFKKQNRAQLDSNELASLQTELVKTRLAAADDIAQRIGLYVSLDALRVPAMPQGRLPSLPEMYEWQWNYWVAEDVLMAVRGAQGEAARVVDAPVKRVLALNVLTPVAAAGSAGGSSPSPAGGGSFSMGGFGGDMQRGGGGSSEGEAAAPTAGGQPIDPIVEAPLDYAASFTGRKSNSLYDVRLVELKVITTPQGLTLLTDALAKQNFMTVLDVSLAPADAHAAAAAGFIYGSSPVSEATLTIETVWLREWTSLKMPSAMKQSLGIATPPSPETPAGN
jgi:hypothetical protein